MTAPEKLLLKFIMFDVTCQVCNHDLGKHRIRNLTCPKIDANGQPFFDDTTDSFKLYDFNIIQYKDDVYIIKKFNSLASLRQFLVWSTST